MFSEGESEQHVFLSFTVLHLLSQPCHSSSPCMPMTPLCSHLSPVTAGFHCRPQVLGVLSQEHWSFSEGREVEENISHLPLCLDGKTLTYVLFSLPDVPQGIDLQLSAVLSCLIKYPMLTSCPSLISYRSIPSALRITFHTNY